MHIINYIVIILKNVKNAKNNFILFYLNKIKFYGKKKYTKNFFDMER